MKRMLAFCLVFSLSLLCGCSQKANTDNNRTLEESGTNSSSAAVESAEAQRENNKPSTQDGNVPKKYTVQIDGKTYEADSEEEIERIIDAHIFGEIDSSMNEAKSKSDETSDTNNASNGYLAVELGEVTEISSDFIEFYFKVRNISNENINTVTINVDILDSAGDIVDTTHPQKSSTIKPGQGLIIDCVIKNERGAVSAIVSSYSLNTEDDRHIRERIDNSPKVEFVARKNNASSGDLEKEFATEDNNVAVFESGENNILEDFVDNYNNYINEYSTLSETNISLMTLKDAQNGSFKPTQWSSFDIHLGEDGKIEKIIYMAEGEAAAENEWNFLDVLASITAIMVAVDENVTENQRSNYMSGLLDYDLSSEKSYSSTINNYRYEYDLAYGCLRFVVTKTK